jgi:hypothetical protein
VAPALPCLRTGGVGRVAGVRYQHCIARVDVGEGQHEDRLLGPNRRGDLLKGVEAHTETGPKPPGDGLAELEGSLVAWVS